MNQIYLRLYNFRIYNIYSTPPKEGASVFNSNQLSSYKLIKK